MNHVRRLLSGFPLALRAGHLDLLVFLATHSCTLMASDQLAMRVGASPTELAAALEDLTTTGLVVRKQHERSPTALYQLATSAQQKDVAAVLQLASTRRGRLELRRALPQAAAIGEPESPVPLGGTS